MAELLGSNPFNILPHFVALLVAYLLAFPIGWNREHAERSAGLRTFPLVAVATCGVIQAAEHMVGGAPEAMARIVEGLITGMGFIGGGAILRLKDSVRGTATAASLWITGAIGIAVGLGSYDVAVVLSLATIITLWALSGFKEKVIEEEPQGFDESSSEESGDKKRTAKPARQSR
jgi:putative Mg2+ transporter-C (MgtC) family protein